MEKTEQLKVLNSLRKLSTLTWQQIYTNPGLKWEQIHQRSAPRGKKLYSLRISQVFHVLAYREGK